MQLSSSRDRISAYCVPSRAFRPLLLPFRRMNNLSWKSVSPDTTEHEALQVLVPVRTDIVSFPSVFPSHPKLVFG
eukprot:scaffold741_cov336-Pavlova_lutheri.AAC.42